MFANTVVIPITIGEAFDLSAGEVAGSLQRSFLYTSAACVLQAYFGHKYPIMEGQSGLWWGTILSLSASAAAGGMSLSDLGGALTTGIILSGTIILILGAFGIGNILKRFFTPVVMSTVLFLLSSQLIVIFTKGMLGFTADGQINISMALLSIFLIILVSFLTIKGRGMLSNFAILIGIVTGWIIYVILFPNNAFATTKLELISLFPWESQIFRLGLL